MNQLAQAFQRDMIKTYRKSIWSKFIKAIKEYRLLEPGDTVAVAVSGGKDSLLMAALFRELERHPIMPLRINYIAMDPGYSGTSMELLKRNAEALDIPLMIRESNIFRVVERLANDYPCYMCARMRRGFLYSAAQELGCNKLALGHHFDDIIETTMMSILFSGQVRTMIPKLPSENFDNMELIRPMSMIRESYIIKIIKNNNMVTMNCGCEIQVCSTSSKRQLVKSWIQDLAKDHPDIEQNIYKATENVDMDGIIGWIRDGHRESRYQDE